jgi:hypothetical protein
LTSGERTRIRALLGLDFRATVPKKQFAQTIRYTFIELRKPLCSGIASEQILEKYATVAQNSSGAARALHQAFVWECLSLGLVLAFAILLKETKIKVAAERFNDSFSKRARWPGIRDIDPAEDAAPLYVRALLQRAIALGPAALGLDPIPLDIARTLVTHKKVEAFLSSLLDHHRQVKLGEAWVVPQQGTLRVIANKKNLDLVSHPRTYRIDAFTQLLHDLRSIP